MPAYIKQCCTLQVAYRAHVCVCVNHRFNTKDASLVGGILRSSCAGDSYRSICYYSITTARRRETIQREQGRSNTFA